MNSGLYNKRIKFPEEMKEYMKQTSSSIQNADQYTEGFKRNQELQNQNSISYQQLKRIKNFFDSFKGDPRDASYILNGGEKMKGWVDGALRFLRDSLYNTKHNKSEAGMENQHIKNHEKNGGEVRPSKRHKKTSEKHDTAIAESIERINQLINY